MKSLPFDVTPAPSSMTSYMTEVQAKIARLYTEPGEVEAWNDAKANELLQAIRGLEDELVGIRKAQPGYYL